MKTIETIDDMIEAQYGVSNGRIAKDAPVLSSTTGAKNNLYSYGLFLGISLEANAFGILPKKPWNTTGYRVVNTASATAGVGIAEGGAIPATVKSTYFECDMKCKVSAHAFDMSSTMIALKGKEDVLAWEDVKDVEAKTFDNNLNRSLLMDTNTLAGNSIESIDRMINTEACAITNHTYTASDADPWTLLDRSDTSGDNIGTWADAEMSENSNTDREFSLSYIDTILAAAAPYWDTGLTGKVFLTGYDTLFDWSQEFLPAQQLPVTRVQMGVNGVKALGNSDAGLIVNAYNGIPIIASNNVPKDTKSRIYLIDTDNMSIDLLVAPEFLESQDYQAIDKFAREGVFHMEGELVCTKFKSQGAVWDLK